MTFTLWARFAPSMPRVIAVPGLAKSLDARTARPPALAAAAEHVDAAVRPGHRARQQQLVAPALREFLIPSARVLPTGCPIDHVGSSNTFDAVRGLIRWRNNVSVVLVVAVTTVALLVLVATFLASLFSAAVLTTLFFSLQRRYVKRRRDARVTGSAIEAPRVNFVISALKNTT